jgi:hypothetical protein
MSVKWVMLIYKLPRSKTTAKKVAIWRKLKKLGVCPLQDSVCILPHSERTLEHFEWLAEEIKEMGGNATLWETKSLIVGQEEQLREYFLEQVNGQYREIIAAAHDAADTRQLQELWLRFNRVRTQDHLRSPLWIEVKGVLEQKMTELSGRGEAD